MAEHVITVYPTQDSVEITLSSDIYTAPTEEFFINAVYKEIAEVTGSNILWVPPAYVMLELIETYRRLKKMGRSRWDL